MVDESSLRDSLILVATELKKQYLMLSAILNELAAVRESVRGLDPTFSDVLAERQRRIAVEPDKSVSAQVKILDGLIDRATRVVYYR
ncbi:MAG TPA: hypothetical protein VK709_01655 [Candidatus Saccharimonadales bacterium]|nr:hypothetical protein [Candidatus Saccharimonadales bacterium]